MAFQPFVFVELSQTTEAKISVSPCDRVWIPKVGLKNDAVVLNGDAVVSVRFSRNEQAHPMALKDGYANVLFAAGIRDIYVKVLDPGTSGREMFIATGTAVGIGYGDTDGISPQVTGAVVPTGIQWNAQHLGGGLRV